MKLWLGKRKASPEEFWAWFGKHESEVRASAGKPDVIQRITKELERVNQNLVFEIGLDRAANEWQFVVSADGVREHIPAVFEMVSLAPQVPGWRILAFRQPSDLTGVVLEVDGTKLALDSITCQFAETSDGGVVIRLYIPVPKSMRQRDVDRIGFLALDSAIGEYEVMTQFVGYEFLATKPEEQRGNSISSLRETLTLTEEKQP
jgi:hypothetical protein